MYQNSTLKLSKVKQKVIKTQETWTQRINSILGGHTKTTEAVVVEVVAEEVIPMAVEDEAGTEEVTRMAVANTTSLGATIQETTTTEVEVAEAWVRIRVTVILLPLMPKLHRDLVP